MHWQPNSGRLGAEYYDGGGAGGMQGWLSANSSLEEEARDAAVEAEAAMDSSNAQGHGCGQGNAGECHPCVCLNCARLVLDPRLSVSY